MEESNRGEQRRCTGQAVSVMEADDEGRKTTKTTTSLQLSPDGLQPRGFIGSSRSMSSPVDPSQLSDSQKSALDTYTSVTGQEPSAAIPLLRRSEWNVQVS